MFTLRTISRSRFSPGQISISSSKDLPTKKDLPRLTKKEEEKTHQAGFQLFQLQGNTDQYSTPGTIRRKPS